MPPSPDSGDADPQPLEYGDFFYVFALWAPFKEKERASKGDKESSWQVPTNEKPDHRSVEEFLAELSPPSKPVSARKAARKQTQKVTESKGQQPSTTSLGPRNTSSLHQSKQQQQRRQSHPPAPPSLAQPPPHLAPHFMPLSNGFTSTGAEYTPSSRQHFYHPPQDPNAASFNMTSPAFDLNPSSYFATNALPQYNGEVVYGGPSVDMDGMLDGGIPNAGGQTSGHWEGMNIGGGLDTTFFLQAAGGPSSYPRSAYFTPYNTDPPLQ